VGLKTNNNQSNYLKITCVGGCDDDKEVMASFDGEGDRWSPSAIG
jgi:hypothetical protein